jgi:hypothetical protein
MNSYFGTRNPGVETTELRSQNVTYEERNGAGRFAYRTNDNRTGRVTFHAHAPQPLVEVCAAVRYQVRVPPPEDAHYQIDVSTDGGATWQLLAVSDIPTDNEHSSGWLAGSVDVSAAIVKDALVEVQFYAGGHKTGLIDARLYGIYETEPAGPLTITYGWKENGQPRQHTERIAAGTNETTFTVLTGANIEDDFVRLAAE